ncbi:uncharacterized protein K460DRAFT_33772 [Cucurbitaria berberidis CBS 394.84]|uniref:Uncharacterized protein n=1 Tax=Cucurbitaria berberidis CBS 394.84 TaxID=1168544 RepID=A0A9P4GT94_9PLEO|nr:uncharacterized protein K460DRAFT_33772 [Cucurbitaria berberidis CBS 394.84]KAF1851387.1 hypothetical protein K460DRAFT_33772 [Cucurbitaria berberidis CBS 394.84]
MLEPLDMPPPPWCVSIKRQAARHIPPKGHGRYARPTQCAGTTTTTTMPTTTCTAKHTHTHTHLLLPFFPFPPAKIRPHSLSSSKCLASQAPTRPSTLLIRTLSARPA